MSRVYYIWVISSDDVRNDKRNKDLRLFKGMIKKLNFEYDCRIYTISKLKEWQNKYIEKDTKMSCDC